MSRNVTRPAPIRYLNSKAGRIISHHNRKRSSSSSMASTFTCFWNRLGCRRLSVKLRKLRAQPSTAVEMSAAGAVVAIADHSCFCNQRTDGEALPDRRGADAGRTILGYSQLHELSSTVGAKNPASHLPRCCRTNWPVASLPPSPTHEELWLSRFLSRRQLRHLCGAPFSRLLDPNPFYAPPVALYGVSMLW